MTTLNRLAAGAALLLAGCGTRPAEVRYKVTVEIEEGDILRIGSAVWSRSLGEPQIALANSYSGKFQGEAVAVSLSNGRTLFAILRGGDGDQAAAQLLPERAFGDIGRDARGEPRKFGSDRVADLHDIASRIGERQVIDCKASPGWCPMLVRFAKEGDPRSVSLVDPTDLQAAFGDGVTFTSDHGRNHR